MKIGAVISNRGYEVCGRRMLNLAKGLEEAGADSLWLSDHIVMSRRSASRYPSDTIGRTPPYVQDPATPWFEALSSASWLASGTVEVEIGIGVLVLPQRNPVEVGKVAATIDQFSGGRFLLGVGAGWQRREFEVLGYDFASRGRRLDEGIEVLREVWGEARKPSHLSRDTFTFPYPARDGGVPILVGGMSPAARRRAVERGDGWFAAGSLDEDSQADLLRALRDVHSMRAKNEVESVAGRRDSRDTIRVLMPRRLPSIDTLLARYEVAQRIGFDEIVFDLDIPGVPITDIADRIAGLRRRVDRVRSKP